MGLFSKRKTQPLPKDPTLLLCMAQAETDPVEKYARLTAAETLAPEDLSVQRALLMLGKLYRRDGRTPNARLIKYYLFHIFEHPEAHPEKEQQEMAREFFDHPRLKRCLALSHDPEAFLREYLREMAESYIHVFIEGDSSHGVSLLGMPLAGKKDGRLARPVADVIRNILLCPFLTVEEQLLLGRIFYQAYYRYAEGRTRTLDGLLGPEICGLLA